MYSSNNLFDTSNVVDLSEFLRIKEQERQYRLKNDPVELFCQMQSCLWDQVADSLDVPMVFSSEMKSISLDLWYNTTRKSEVDKIPDEEEVLQPDFSFDWIAAYK